MSENTTKREPTILKRTILSLGVIIAGAGIAILIFATGPKAQRKAKTRDAVIVDVRPVTIENHITRIRALGTVVPARSVELRPLVNGAVASVSPSLIPGGLIGEGDLLVRLDGADYQVAVDQREAAVASARASLDVEMGQQQIAARELEMFEGSTDGENTSLARREPQLAMARATLMSAEAALSQARLNLRRTAVRSPFNAVVLEKYVSVGSQAGPSASVAKVVGTDEFWVETAVPVADLRWIRTGENGSPVRVYDEAAWGPGVYRTGTVLRILGSLDQQSRMANVLVSVPDPLSLEGSDDGAPALLLDAYVNVEIEGSEIESVAALERSVIRAGNQAWVMNDRDELEIRPLEVVYGDADSVFVSAGLNQGERLVVSSLSAAVDGLPLSVRPDVQ